MSEHPSVTFLTSEKRNLIVLLGLFLLLAFFSTSIASYFISKNAIRESVIKRELPMTSDNIYTEIQNDLLLPLYISSTMANNTFLRDWALGGEDNTDKITNYLSEIKKEYGSITSFFISEHTHIYYYTEGILKTVREDEPRDAWYFRVRDMEAPYEINVDPDMANKDTITIFINYRVLDFKGNFIGATGVGLTVDNLKGKINEYKERYEREIYFIDKSGKIILLGGKALPHLAENKHIKDIEGLSDIYPSVLSTNATSQEYRNGRKTLLLNSRFIPELNWILMVEQNIEGSIRPVRNILYINILVCVLVTLVVLIIISFTVLRYQRNIAKRNIELESKNHKIDQQKQQLENHTVRQEEINARLEILNQEKDEFLGIAAHDLRSPLSAIVSAADIMLTEELPQEQVRVFLEHIAQNATNMLDLITNLLDVTALEMIDNPRFNNADLRLVTRETIASFATQASAKQIELKTDLTPNPVWVQTYGDWLSHIVSNLVSNAIKYSPKGATVWVNLSDADQSALFTVVDQGPGLTLEDKQHLFSRFTRLSAKPTGNESSSGLGLYIVKKLTEKLGGKAWCDSDYGVGSSFFIEFPLVQNDPL